MLDSAMGLALVDGVCVKRTLRAIVWLSHFSFCSLPGVHHVPKRDSCFARILE